jgi:hypothetical protein
MLAGWLFADLLLVLFITVFASLPSPPAVASKAKATVTKPHPAKHNEPPQPRALERNPQTFYVNVSPSAINDPATHSAAVAQLTGDLRKQLVADGLGGRQAGFVLVFAYGPITGIGQAISTATSVVNILRAKESGFSQISGLGLWSGSGEFEFKIFFFA